MCTKAYFVGGCYDGVQRTLDRHQDQLLVINTKLIREGEYWYNGSTTRREITLIYDVYEPIYRGAFPPSTTEDYVLYQYKETVRKGEHESVN